ncbi:MAG: hypothetical protein EXS11_08360 [Gemmataceae bacterium]|nr:hypothetical protein [Gemmataceae bacterium]
MQVVVPMTGRGSRFAAAGYDKIKPLIKVDGIPIIEHIVRQFSRETDFLFVCANDHLECTSLKEVLMKVAPTGRIVGVDYEKKGPVWAALQAADHIKDDIPTLLHYCDFAVFWDFEEFKKTMKALGPAGCVQAYRGFHPHLLGPNKYANMRDDKGWMLEIKEKHIFSKDRFSEYSSTGAYYFQSGKLLKETFRLAIQNDLLTNGEYYASTPFNLLLEQAKHVWIYEVPYFLQWGTPEDLEEYQHWSDYFRLDVFWKPRQRYPNLQILMPMVGAGTRFKQEGYQLPKPLVPVAGVPMVQRALDSYPSGAKWVCVMRKEDAVNPKIVSIVQSSERNPKIVSIEGMTEGQATTCLLGFPYLNPEAPLLIAPCDSSVIYDELKLNFLIADQSIDCLVWTFRNHPHANRNPNQYGWVQANRNGQIERISCKVALGPNVKTDPGIIGIFWFRKARYFQSAAEDLIRQNRRVNNEFYADSAIEVLLEQGLKACLFDVHRLICFGVPQDVKTYDYWEAYFRKSNNHPYGKIPCLKI